MSRLKKRETWRVHPEFTNYEVFNCGRVRRQTAKYGATIGRILKGQISKYGYNCVILCQNGTKKGKRVHRLVLETFVGPCPENYICNHKNGIKTKNFLYNLEWVTTSENQIHAYKTGLKKQGIHHHKAKLKEGEVWLIKKLLKESKLSCRKIAAMFKVCGSTIEEIKSGENWKHINL